MATRAERDIRFLIAFTVSIIQLNDDIPKNFLHYSHILENMRIVIWGERREERRKRKNKMDDTKNPALLEGRGSFDESLGKDYGRFQKGIRATLCEILGVAFPVAGKPEGIAFASPLLL